MSPLRIPPAVKTLFDFFPLLTLPDDPLPSGCPNPDPKLPSLYIFTTPSDASLGNPSFNPSCLKWQTYLKLCNLTFRTTPSTNHASPTGALPFLITPGTLSYSTIPSNRLLSWAHQNGSPPDEVSPEDPKLAAFQSLVDSQLRDAWLYAVYLEPANLTLTSAQYRATRVPLLHHHLTQHMHSSALQQLLETRPGGVVDGDEIYADAEAAVEALSVELGDEEWFFGGREPGMFEAVVFGYLYLVLTGEWDEREARLRRAVRKWANLVGLVERVRRRVFPDAKAVV